MSVELPNKHGFGYIHEALRSFRIKSETLAEPNFQSRHSIHRTCPCESTNCYNMFAYVRGAVLKTDAFQESVLSVYAAHVKAGLQDVSLCGGCPVVFEEPQALPQGFRV